MQHYSSQSLTSAPLFNLSIVLLSATIFDIRRRVAQANEGVSVSDNCNKRLRNALTRPSTASLHNVL